MKTILLSGLLAVVALPLAQQDVTFRLLNLERRCDQLQQRVDFLERQQQQSLSSLNNAANDPNRELIVEFQRQLLSLNQQLLDQQRQQLELRKALDRQTERVQALEQRLPDKKSEAEAKPAPKPAPRRP
jgi:predicted  nucleic acid-binding Zn-ribbon protein